MLGVSLFCYSPPPPPDFFQWRPALGVILSWEHKTIFFSGNKLTSTGSCFWLLCFPERPTQHTASGKLRAIQSSSRGREGSWGTEGLPLPAEVGRPGERLQTPGLERGPESPGGAGSTAPWFTALAVRAAGERPLVGNLTGAHRSSLAEILALAFRRPENLGASRDKGPALQN